jgi:hypothetical protein
VKKLCCSAVLRDLRPHEPGDNLFGLRDQTEEVGG